MQSNMVISNQYLVVIELLLVLASILITVQSVSRCNRSCGDMSPSRVPFPFGFSDGCEIRLNCTLGRVSIGEFELQNITEKNIEVTLPAKCNHPINSLMPLFGQNYAPTSSQNSLLLYNCSSPPNGCIIPTALFDSNFMRCGPDPPYCFSNENESGFMAFSDVDRSNCKFLFSSIFFDGNENSATVSIEFQVFQLEWWLKGKCTCSDNSICTDVVFSGNQQPGYRCRCAHGFLGDGFAAGAGCHPKESSKCNLSKYFTGECRGRARIGVLIAASLIGIMAFIAIVMVFCYIWKHSKTNFIIFGKRKKKAQSVVEKFLKNYGTLAPKRYTYKDIAKITSSFKSKIGQGGYGGVYKGKLFDGRLVAVKVLNKAKGDGEEFINEVGTITRTSHVNVVSLLGFCFEGSKRALIYEFMVNGSLEKFIYDSNSLHKQFQLGWETLFQIAIGVAKGLEYLHRGCNTRILHFDIKPHNILLDQDFTPKISDFGLAKLCPSKESIISMLGARGTVGYIAPEVFNNKYGGVSHKSDVYSYGMMVLEIVGRRKNIEIEVDSLSKIYFPQWIYKRLILNEDLGLHGMTSLEETEIARKMILVALWCIQTNPMDRPSMNRAVDMLEGRNESLPVPPKPYLCSPPRSPPSGPSNA